MFGMMPLSFATFPAIALRLSGCDAERLKRSLAKALELVPCAAGRLKDDARMRLQELANEYKKILYNLII